MHMYNRVKRAGSRRLAVAEVHGSASKLGDFDKIASKGASPASPLSSSSISNSQAKTQQWFSILPYPTYFPKIKRKESKKTSLETIFSKHFRTNFTSLQVPRTWVLEHACRHNLFLFIFLAGMADPFISLKNEVESTLREISSAHDWTSRFVSNPRAYLVQVFLYCNDWIPFLCLDRLYHRQVEDALARVQFDVGLLEDSIDRYAMRLRMDYCSSANFFFHVALHKSLCHFLILCLGTCRVTVNADKYRVTQSEIERRRDFVRGVKKKISGIRADLTGTNLLKHRDGGSGQTCSLAQLHIFREFHNWWMKTRRWIWHSRCVQSTTTARGSPGIKKRPWGENACTSTSKSG